MHLIKIAKYLRTYDLNQALIGSPDRKRKVPPGIAVNLNEDEKEQVLA